MIKLLPHQERAIKEANNRNKIGYYLDMGLGKTFVGSEQAKIYGNDVISFMIMKFFRLLVLRCLTAL